MPTPTQRSMAIMTVAIALSSIVMMPTSVTAESRILSILSGHTSQPADRNTAKADRLWLFGSSSKATSPPPPQATGITEDRRRIPSGSGAGVTTTQRAVTPHSTAFPVRQTSTTTTTVFQKLETTTHKFESTTKDRYIISAPLQTCPDGQRMNPDRKCVDNYTDPEESK